MATVAALPESDQERIGRNVLSHVEKLRRLRAELDKGIESLQEGEGTPQVRRGLEIRRDVWIGLGLMAPHSRYPDHRHPPEEIYAVLSDGQWRQASDPWHAPGIGGLVYNPPNVCTRCA